MGAVHTMYGEMDGGSLGASLYTYVYACAPQTLTLSRFRTHATKYSNTWEASHIKILNIEAILC